MKARRTRITLMATTLLLYILALATASADVTVNENTSISPLAVNTTFYFATTFTFSYIDIYDDHVDFGGFDFYAIPSPATNPVNITLSKLTQTDSRFTANSLGEVTFTIGGLQPDFTYLIQRSDGLYYDSKHNSWTTEKTTALTNHSGYISFTNSQWSEKGFTITLYNPGGEVPTPTPQPTLTPTPAPTIPPIPPPEHEPDYKLYFTIAVAIVTLAATAYLLRK
ncbi:hypothetical protein DRP07_00075 [Archaeoglobales archaeon]|nr:MAG: hypothetical protein DRP07_00075 [Archaeoglobales archaeon]